MLPAMTHLEVVANNLANLNTVGFKKDGVFLRMVLTAEQALGPEGEVSEASMVLTDYSEGTLTETGRPFDLALRGDGFFTVEAPEGLRYTRAGNFTLSPEGVLVTSDGYPVLGENGPLVIEGTQVSIGEDGEVSVDGEVVNRLLITDFAKPYALRKVGHGLFAPRSEDVVGTVAEHAVVRQGFLEGSNVQAMEEMVRMIALHRQFELDQRAVQVQDETLNKVVNDAGRV